jgi:hypothetical protein
LLDLGVLLFGLSLIVGVLKRGFKYL